MPPRKTPEEKQLEAARTAADQREILEAEGAYVSPTRPGAVDSALTDEAKAFLAEHTRPGSVEPPLHDDTELDQMAEDELIHDEGIWSEVHAALAAAKPRGLHAKLAEIMEIADRIPKRGTAPAAMGGYKFVQVGDAADPIRRALAARGITMMPHELETVDLSYGVGKNGNMNMHTIKMVWRLTDSETGEFFDLPSYGTGGDTGDKFSPKAQTNAMKYALLMGFLLSTGDDPEAADLSDPAQGAPITITGSNVPGVQQGGRQTGATQIQLDQIRRRARDLDLAPESMAVLIASALGGKAPDIDNLETTDAQRAILAFLGSLTFAECADVLGRLEGTLTPLESALAPEDVGAK